MNKKLTHAVIAILAVSMVLSTFPFPTGSGASENEWTTKNPMPTARGGFGVAVANGKIYAIGGLNNNTNLAVNQEYDPAANSWRTKTPMPTPRSGCAVASYQGKIYVIGGTVGVTTDLVSEFTGAVEVYDPATDTWETKTSMPTPRADLRASVVNGKIYLIGGKERWGEEPLYHELDANEVYDPTNDSWTTAAPMPIPAFGYASAVVAGKIYVFGGARQLRTGFNDLTSVGSTQVYDAKNNTWTSKTSLPSAVSFAAAEATGGLTAPQRIYFTGGFDQSGYSATVRVYDVERDRWGSAAVMPTARGYLAMAVVEDVLYAIGGFNGETWLATNEEYMPFGYGTVPPELHVLSPENTTYTNNNVSLVLSVNKPTTWIGYSLDGQLTVTVTGDTVLTGVPEGQHSMIVYVNDTFGNVVSSGAIYFSVDTRPPDITVFSPENKTYDGSDIQSVIGVDEPASWIGYSLDGQDNVTITANVTLAVLNEGSHNITFYAIDLVGNQGASNTIYFKISTFPTVWVVGVAVTITIVVAASYLLLKRRKTSTAKTEKQPASGKKGKT
jgi:N-acetylneuraminic acid mutarotase